MSLHKHSGKESYFMFPEKDVKPKIPKGKPEPQKTNSKYAHNYLTKVERLVLWKKYVKSGNNYETANQKVKLAVEYIDKFMMKFKEKNTSNEKDLNIKFKEEFAKLCMQAE